MMTDWIFDYVHLPAAARGPHCVSLYRPSDTELRLVGWGRTREQALAALRERASEYGDGMLRNLAIAKVRQKQQLRKRKTMTTLQKTNLLTGAASTIPGFSSVHVNLEKFADFCSRAYANHVAYGFGSKDPHPGSGKIDFTEIDCSGWVRTLLMYACEGTMNGMPDGSYTQGEWLASKGFKPTTRDTGLLSDDHIRCFVHHPDGLDETGHIWLTMNGHTVESFGSHGPGQRNPRARLRSGHTLDELVSVGYVLS